MKKHLHPFNLKNWWTSADSVVSYLINNIIYNKGGLIVINKPYGLMQMPVKPRNNSAHITKSLINTAAAGDCNYSLHELLPHIARGLGCRSLHIVKTPERYESGVGILASTDGVADKVKKCFRRAKPLQKLTSSYWAVVVGVPHPECAKNTYGVKLKILPDGDKQAMLTDQWSQTSIRQGDVKVVSVQHRTLGSGASGHTSLVEVMTSGTKWHFVRLYLSYLLSPALGDNLFGSRVAEVLGQKVLLPLSNDTIKQPQKLSSEILSALRLEQGSEVMVPVHLHLQQSTLINYFGKGKDLVLKAPAPEVFRQTCDWLGLDLPDNKDVASQTLSMSGNAVSS